MAAVAINVVAFVSYLRWTWQFPETLRASPSADSPALMADFRTFYAAGEMIREGDADQLYNVDAQRRVGTPPILADTPATYYNQPLVGVLFVPTTVLSLRHSFQFWTLASLVLIAVAVFMVFKAVPELPVRLKVLLSVCLISSYPLQHLLYVGQLVPITMLSLAGGFWYLKRSRPRQAGWWFALGILKYPFVVGPFVYLVANRNWRTLRVLALVGLGMLVASLAIVGPGGLIANARLVMNTTTDSASEYGTSIDGMLNWRGFSATVFGDTSGIIYFGGIAATCLFALATAVRSWRRFGPQSSEAIAACILLSFLLANQVHYQDALLLLMALVFVCDAAWARGLRGLAFALCGGWLFWFSGGLPYDGYFLTIIPLLGLLALLWHWSTERQPAYVAAPASHAWS